MTLFFAKFAGFSPIKIGPFSESSEDASRHFSKFALRGVPAGLPPLRRGYPKKVDFLTNVPNAHFVHTPPEVPVINSVSISF